MNDPQQFFSENLNKYTTMLNDTKGKLKRVSMYRVLVFLATATGIYISVANGYPIVAAVFCLGIVLFIYLVYRHYKMELRKQRLEILCEINDEELKLIIGDFTKADGGEDFKNSDHNYSDDLDVFGSKSLFQLINRTSTLDGRVHLADRLKNPLYDIHMLKSRQEAIKELREMPDLRQNFQAEGRSFVENPEDVKNLVNWSQTNEKVFNKIGYRILLVLNPVVAAAVIVLINYGFLNYSAFILFLIFPITIVGSQLGVLNRIHNQVSSKAGMLKGFSGLFGIVGESNFTSELMIKARKELCENVSASAATKELAKITKLMDYRLNMIMGILLNVFLLWDIKQAIKAEKWKNSYADKLGSWFEELAQVDEIQSFAGFAFQYNNSVFPDFYKNDFKITATNVRHPLINQKKCIGNDHIVNRWKEYKIITGANMAGKSTYLRTIGINIVLALTGSVVLADSYSIYPVKVFTGIKTTDSIQDGESYFFAELKRLKELIDHLEEGQKLYVILDEVLRGTNSADKQKGSMSLITQLLKLNSSGIIATHDLTLGNLADEFPDNVENNRFEVEIYNNELVFDYKLKEGISKNLNATFLMKKMGITV